jgi:hypothetical protein
MKLGWSLSVFMVALFAVSSCGDGGARVSPSPLPINPTALADQDFESTLLADGDVSFEDYERAFLAYSKCAEDAGWSFVEQPRLTSRMNYEFRWVMIGGANLPPDAMQAAQQTLEKCRLANFDELQRVWSLKTALSDSERQVARDQLGDCLRDRGVKDVPQHPASSDWERFIVVGSGMDLTSRQAFRECKAAVQDAFGLLTTEVP